MHAFPWCTDTAHSRSQQRQTAAGLRVKWTGNVTSVPRTCAVPVAVRCCVHHPAACRLLFASRDGMYCLCHKRILFAIFIFWRIWVPHNPSAICTAFLTSDIFKRRAATHRRHVIPPYNKGIIDQCLPFESTSVSSMGPKHKTPHCQYF